jgi:hypothetical protein
VLLQSIGTTAGAIGYVQDGDVITEGSDSIGIVAQSITGAGGYAGGDFAGDGGTGIAGLLTLDVSGGIQTSGDGAIGALLQTIGGDGGAISYTQTGNVITGGDGAVGVVAQSLGGGGGLVDGIFGNAGTSGNGGAIAFDLTGSIGTAGDAAHGVLLQSIGGGDGSAITYSQAGDVFTGGNGSVGIIVQSLGGGGSFAGEAFGNGAGAGNAGPIAFDLAGSVQTVGDGSHGVLLQTIGGGDAGTIHYSQAGDVTTAGDGAIGIIAQSLGGGGGFAGGIFGNAGGTGDAGAISFDLTGSVFTDGDASHGVLLQSIGGGSGGGIDYAQVGDIVAMGDNSIGLAVQSLGGGGSLDEGALGAASFAAQAVPMAAVPLAASGGTAGAVTLDITGSIVAPGVNSTAVFAQSDGPDGAGDITITASGDIRGGSGTGAGVRLAGGADNLVTINGTLSAVSGLAMESGSGNDQLANTGVVVGNLILGGGANSVFNAEGSTFVTIDTLDLRDGAGSTGTFTNAGDLLLGRSAPRYPIDLLAGETWDASSLGAPALAIDPEFDLYLGTTVISQVSLDGDFIQTDTGYDAFDIAFGPYASDRVDVTGNATVDGTADITLTWLENANPVALFATGGVGVDNGLTVPDTIALDYKILAGDAGIELAFDSDFGQDFLTANGQALGQHMDSALQVGGASGIGRLMALLGNLTAGQEALYADIFDELDPEALTAPSLTQFVTAREFGQQLFGCELTSKGPDRTCIWGQVGTHSIKRDTDRGDLAFKQSGGVQLRVGVDQPLGNDFSVAAAFGYDELGKLRFDDGRAKADGNGIHGGIGVRKLFGAAGAGSASLTLSAGRQKNDLSRNQTIFVSGLGRSHYTTSYVQAAANVGYSFDVGTLFLRPELDGSMTGLKQHSFTEKGLEGLGMVGASDTEWVGTLSPHLTLGADISSTARISFTGGAVFHNKGQISHPFRFIGTDPSSDAAIIATRFDKSAFMAGANVAILGNSWLKMDVGYRGEFGKSMTSHTGHVDIRIPF